MRCAIIQDRQITHLVLLCETKGNSAQTASPRKLWDMICDKEETVPLYKRPENAPNGYKCAQSIEKLRYYKSRRVSGCRSRKEHENEHLGKLRPTNHAGSGG